MLQISLKAARVNAGMSQKDLAKAIERNVSTIINWETGKTTINVPDFRKLCRLLGLQEDNIYLPINQVKLDIRGAQ